MGRAVVGTAHADELRAPREALGELERPLDRLGARVHEVEAVDGLRQQRGDLRGIAHLRPLDQLAVDHHVHVARRLLLHGPHHGGIGMADVAHRDARHQVVVAAPLGGVKERTLGPLHLDQHRRGRRLAHVGQELFA